MKRAVVGIARHPKETDFLSPYSARRNRGFTALLLSGGLLVAPLLLTRQGESAADQAVTSRPAASGLAVAARLLNDEMYVPPVTAPPPARVVIASSAPAQTRTTKAVTRTPVTVAPKAKAKASPRPKGTATPASAAPPTPATEPEGNAQQGHASWYDAPAGTCAHKTLPMGTVITVTAVSSGRQITCSVADRGPYIKGRVIDLSRERFNALADTSAGVIQVRIEW
jgi:rare lipoprotein A